MRTIEEIICHVAYCTGVAESDILSKSKIQAVVDAQRLAIFLARKEGFGSLEIQATFDITRAGVWHHIEKHAELVKYNTAYRELFDKIK